MMEDRYYGQHRWVEVNIYLSCDLLLASSPEYYAATVVLQASPTIGITGGVDLDCGLDL